MILVFCFGLTAAIDDKSTIDILGYIFIVLILGLITANAIYSLVGVVKKAILKLKRTYIQFKVG